MKKNTIKPSIQHIFLTLARKSFYIFAKTQEMSRKLLSQSDSVGERLRDHQPAVIRDDHHIQYTTSKVGIEPGKDGGQGKEGGEEGEEWNPKLIPRSIKLSLSRQGRPRL